MTAVDELAALGGPRAVRASLPPAWPRYSEAVAARVADAVRRGDVYAFGGHPALHELEEWARSYFGSPYALAVSSGTAALASAFAGLGVGPGDEVLVQSYTFHATATPLFSLGALPVLVDSVTTDPRMDLADAEAKITPRTRALVVTHMFGLPCDMDEAVALARRHGLALVEDAAQAHGATYRGRRVGAIGDAGCFSLGGAKPVSGGMGGLLLTPHRAVYDAALVLGHAHERVAEEVDPESAWASYGETGWGANLRMAPVAAMLALDHATTLDDRVAVRTAVLEGLTRRLRAFPFLVPPETPEDRTRGGWYGYKVRYAAARLDGLPFDVFTRLVRAEGVKAERPTTTPLHMTRPFQSRDLGLPGYDPAAARPLYDDDALPNARDLWTTTLSFPDKHLHWPADDVLDQYAEAFAKVERAVAQSGAAALAARLEGVAA